jgi:membrane protease subunit (stomatin/prohibitin family)
MFPLLQSSTVGAGSKTNGVSNGQSQTGGSVNSVGSSKQQQSQQQTQQQQQHQQSQQDPKPVECNLCHRKFKNIPALNGHMRLHGGYFKKVSFSVYIYWVRTALEASAPKCE